MQKLLTGVIAQEMYDYLEQEKFLREEQKECRRKCHGSKNQLLIDKTVLKDNKKRHSNLSMTWINYKKTYDVFPHSWINGFMELFWIADNVKKEYGAMEAIADIQWWRYWGGWCEEKDISGRQPFTTIVCFDHCTFVVDT